MEKRRSYQSGDDRSAPTPETPLTRHPPRAHTHSTSQESRECPYVLEVRLPSIDWEISTIDEQGSFSNSPLPAQPTPRKDRPLSDHSFHVLDALYAPSRAASFRDSFAFPSPNSPPDPSHRFSAISASGGYDRIWRPSRIQSTRSQHRRSRVVSLHDEVESIEFEPLDPAGPGTGEGEPPKALEEYPSGLRLWLIMVAMLMSIFLIGLDMTIVATAIPSITDEFQGLSDVAWYGSVFFMTIGAFQPMWGKIYKYFSLKYSYLAAIVIFEVGSLVCGVAPSSTTFIVGRAISGIGAAGIASGSYTIVGFITDAKRRPLFTGIIGAMFGTSTVLGPLLGGVLTGEVSWRW